MAYKPPKQTIVDNDTQNFPSSEAIFEALKLKLDEPSVSGTAGQLLQLDGYVSGEPVVSWVNPPPTAVTSVSGTAPIASSGGTTPAISISQSSALSDGYLSSTDWSSFNAKQDALPSQTGNTDKVLASNGSTLSWQYAGLGAGSLGTANVILGRNKPASITTGADLIGIGSLALNAITSGTKSIAIGTGALEALTTNGESVAVGYLAGRYQTASNNVFIGSAAGVGSSGVSAGSGFNVGIGRKALVALTTASGAIGIGADALVAATSGGSNIAIGNGTLASLTTNANNVAVGHLAGQRNTAANNTFVGSGSGTGVLDSSTGGSNTAVGRSTLTALTTGASNVAIGNNALLKITSGGSNVAVGSGAFQEATITSQTTAIGNNAGARVTGSDNVFIGAAAGEGSATVANNTAGALVVIGRNAGVGITSLSNSVLIGQLTGSILQNQTNETFVGWRCGRYAIGSNNTYFGAAAGSGNANGTSSTGTNNTAVGVNAGSVLEGSGNTLLGFTAGDAITTGSNNVIIGDIAGTTTLASTIIMAAGTAERFRVDSSGNMGIGTTTPSARLDVNGNIKATSGDVIIDTAGKGLKVKTGANAKMGTASFANVSSVTVNTTAVLSSSLIFVTQQNGGSAFGINNIVNGTSFDIVHQGGNITANVAWIIIDPA